MKARALALLGCLAACGPTSQPDVSSRAMDTMSGRLPPVKYFAVETARAPQQSNAEIARDFNELFFFLESGRPINLFTRFEGPVTVSLQGDQPASLAPDLKQLIKRLKNEAGIPISLTKGKDANIVVQTIPRSLMRQHVPDAACFVVPNVSNWGEFTKFGDADRTDWTKLTARTKVAVFIPSDRSPQEQRDCLHEEIAQALGPLNDIYRLRDSVFNDDNIHSVLTGFDMTILRAAYDPTLRNGMSPAEVSRRVPSVLARVNPAGNRPSGPLNAITPAIWSSSMQKALSPKLDLSVRRQAASKAIEIAVQRGWNGPRRGFAYYALGRLTVRADREAAYRSFIKAYQTYASRPDMALHRAVVAEQLAAFSLSSGDGAQVLSIVTPHLPVAAAYQDAELLSALLMFRAEGLELTGRVSEARSVRLDSLGWARYAYGSETVVRRKLAEITSLNPAK